MGKVSEQWRVNMDGKIKQLEEFGIFDAKRFDKIELRLEKIEKKQIYIDDAWKGYLSWEKSGIVEQVMEKVEELEQKQKDIEEKIEKLQAQFIDHINSTNKEIKELTEKIEKWEARKECV